MKIVRIQLVIAAIFLALCFSADALAVSPDERKGADFAPQEILVKFEPSIGPSAIAEIHRRYGGRVKGSIPALGIQVVAIPHGQVFEKVRAYSANPTVSYAEPNYLCQVVVQPDDTYFSKQWGMNKVKAPQAWDVTTGSSNINVAVLDTGVDLNHPDLANKIITSVNFSNSYTTDDLYGHGTHVAGIAAASTNNGIGVSGLGYDSTIMNVKVLGDDGRGYYTWVANGIIWAANNGAEVINLSLGGPFTSITLESAVEYAWSQGVVVVAAAGNSGSSVPLYPAYYTDCIAVAATDPNDNLPFWSNYGEWVDVAAPGLSIYSTLKDNGYGYKSGTSMASPHVAGLAALVSGLVTDTNGNGRRNDEVRSKIEANCDDIGLTGIGSGRINASKAVGGLSPAPGSISGKVSEAADGSPVEGATVSDGTRSAISDAGGNYTISNVPEGSYTVTASKDGYQTSSLSVDVMSGQTTTANFALTKEALPVNSMWVDSIIFSARGKNLRLDIKVVDEGGAMAGTQVGVKLTWAGGRSWTLSGATDDSGIARFMVRKVPAGDYEATVTSLTASGYTWDTSKGITSDSYTLSGGGKPVK